MASLLNNEHVHADLEGACSTDECLWSLAGSGESLLVSDQNIDTHLDVANCVDALMDAC